MTRRFSSIIPARRIRLSAMPSAGRPLKVFLCHARADRDRVHALREATHLTNDGVDAWQDKEKPCGERSRTILPGQD